MSTHKLICAGAEMSFFFLLFGAAVIFLVSFTSATVPERGSSRRADVYWMMDGIPRSLDSHSHFSKEWKLVQQHVMTQTYSILR